MPFRQPLTGLAPRLLLTHMAPVLVLLVGLAAVIAGLALMTRTIAEVDERHVSTLNGDEQLYRAILEVGGAARQGYAACRVGTADGAVGASLRSPSEHLQARYTRSTTLSPRLRATAARYAAHTDALLAAPTRAEPEARVAQLRAQRKQIEDGLALEVTQAFQAIREADVAMDTSRRQVQSAQEAYRVARELFNAGRATSTTLTDAETDLTRARLEVLNARVDARVARVRLEHAVGRDARQAPAK